MFKIPHSSNKQQLLVAQNGAPLMVHNPKFESMSCSSQPGRHLSAYVLFESSMTSLGKSTDELFVHTRQ